MESHQCDKKLILEKFAQSTPIFQALGDIQRQQIVSLLIELNSLNVTQITEKMVLSRPAVSHHLKILRQAHIIDFQRKGKERFYGLSPKINVTLQTLKDLIQAVEQYQ